MWYVCMYLLRFAVWSVIGTCLPSDSRVFTQSQDIVNRCAKEIRKEKRGEKEGLPTNVGPLYSQKSPN
jgi:hypothetical protein